MEAVIKKMEKNRRYFIPEMITGMGQYTLISGAFLAGFIHMLGGSDSLNGTMGAVPAIMGIMQVFSSLYFERIQQRKKMVVKLVTALRIMMGLIYIVPILLLPYGMSLEVFVVIYVVAFAINALLSPALSELLVDSTPPEIRGRYFAQRERYTFIFTIILSYTMGKVLDYYKLVKMESFSFGLLGVIILSMGIVNIVAMSRVEEVNHEIVPVQYSLKDAITLSFKAKGFRKIIILFILWGIGLQMGAPFISVYMVSTLQLSYSYIMMMSILGTVIRIIVTPIWGKIADNRSWFLSAEASILILAASHMAWAFVDGGNYKVLIPILHITTGFAWGGVGISIFTLQYLFAPKKGRTIFIGVNAALSGLVSLVAVRFSGIIVDRLENNSIEVFGLSFCNLQIVIFLSAIVLLLMPLYIRKSIKKEPIIS